MSNKIPYYKDNSRISNSALGSFIKKGAQELKDFLDGKVKIESKYLDFGRITHLRLLQRDLFRKKVKLLDFEAPKSEQQKQFCKDYISSKATTVVLKAVEAFKANYVIGSKSEELVASEALKMVLKLKGYIKYLKNSNIEDDDERIELLSYAKFNSLKLIEENVKLHKKARELLLDENANARNEYHINWSYCLDDGSRVECKSLIDRIIIDNDNKRIQLIDLKTSADVSNFAKSFDEYDYGRQMAFYWKAIEYHLINELNVPYEEFIQYKQETYIVAVQTTGHYNCRVFNVSEDILKDKFKIIDNLMIDINWHMCEGLWEHNKNYYEGDGVESLDLAA